MDEIDRQQHLVKVNAGKIYDIHGNPIDSGSSANGKLMFVMDQQGNIFVGEQRPLEFHHSSFLAGEPVAAAGEIEVIEGQIVYHNRKSGHYKPDAIHHEQFMAELKDKGIDLDQAIYDDEV